MKLARAQNEMTVKYLIPERIVKSDNAECPEILLTESPRQPAFGDKPYPCCEIKKGGYVILDFGEEICGGAEVTVDKYDAWDDGAELRFVFGESVSEAMSDIGEKNAVNHHAPRDINVCFTYQTHLSVGNTGFRFLKIESPKTNVRITSVQAAFRFRELEYRGSFESDDELLNEIWRVGARTVHLNMQEYIWDGIKRDRMVWVGDMHPEMSTIASVFGETELVRRSLDFARDTTSAKGWINTIPSYSMWWLKIH